MLRILLLCTGCLVNRLRTLCTSGLLLLRCTRVTLRYYSSSCRKIPSNSCLTLPNRNRTRLTLINLTRRNINTRIKNINVSVGHLTDLLTRITRSTSVIANTFVSRTGHAYENQYELLPLVYGLHQINLRKGIQDKRNKSYQIKIMRPRIKKDRLLHSRNQ